MPRLQDDEDLTWHDLYRRLKEAFPDIREMYISILDWREKRAYFTELYQRIDRNQEGKFDKRTYIKQVNQLRKARK